MNPRSLDEARMEAWVRDYGPMVRGYVRGFVRREDLADDLVQEIFRRAWQARGRYDEQGTPRAYLLRIADRLVCDVHRRSGREVTLDERAWREVEPSVEGADPAAELHRREARRSLDHALDALTPAQRRVLLLRYYGQWSFREIAEAMETPLSTVLSHCRRGLLALRELMTEDPA